MPEVCRFLGIVIGIFPREHPPPHFHAAYGEYQITVDIETGSYTGISRSGRCGSCSSGWSFTRANFSMTGV